MRLKFITLLALKGESCCKAILVTHTIQICTRPISYARNPYPNSRYGIDNKALEKFDNKILR